MAHVQHRLGCDLAIGLAYPPGHALGQLGQGVADVHLAAHDVVRPTIQRQRLGQAQYRMLAGGVRCGERAWGVRRDRAVVDDPPALRLLAAHQAEGGAGAQDYTIDIGGDDVAPVLQRQLVDGYSGGVDAGIVEHHVESAMHLLDGGEQLRNALLIAHVSGNGQGLTARCLRLLDDGL
ncbi:hypothetical protein D3C75_986650 [compost metagenome]